MMKYSFLFLAIILVLLTSGCAKFTGDLDPCITGQVYGFWSGLWHGLIAPIGLFVSLFEDQVRMYAPNNNGGWYALGFLFGSGGWGILANQSTRRRKRTEQA